MAPAEKPPQASTGAAPPTGKSAQLPAAMPHRFNAGGSSPLIHFTDLRGAAAGQALDERLPGGRLAENARSAPPPVKITVGPDGKLIISSEDSQVLDLLEQLVAEMPATRKDYRIFHLKYVSAVTLAMNLEDAFKEKKESRDMPWWYYYEYGGSQENDSQDERRLSKWPSLKFISDVDSNTILVQGADPHQMKKIEELVQIYDQPPPTDTQSVRKTELIHLKYSKAKVVADTIKDVYRDLLSANDKALAENNQSRPAQRLQLRQRHRFRRAKDAALQGPAVDRGRRDLEFSHGVRTDLSLRSRRADGEGSRSCGGAGVRSPRGADRSQYQLRPPERDPRRGIQPQGAGKGGRKGGGKTRDESTGKSFPQRQRQ